MINKDWAIGFGWNSRALQFMVGDGKRDPDDPDYDKKAEVYRPHCFCREPIGY